MPISSIAAQVIKDEKERRSNAIAMFRPTEYQEEFLRKFAEDGPVEFLVGGGNRCLAGCQEIYDPVLNVSRRVDEIDSDFHVWSVNPSTGKSEIKKACRPFVKAYGELWRVTLSNGEILHVTPGHMVVGRDGKWVSIQSAWRSGLSLASVSEVCDQTNTLTGCNRTHRFSRQSAELSSSISFQEALRRQGRSGLSSVSSSLLPMEPLFHGNERMLSERLCRRQTSARSRSGNACATVQSTGLGLAFWDCDEIPLAIESGFRGDSLHSAPHHQMFQTSRRSHVSTFSCQRKATVDRFPRGTQSALYARGARDCSKTTEGSPADYLNAPRFCDAQSLLAINADQCAAPSRSDVREHIHAEMRTGDLASTKTCSRLASLFREPIHGDSSCLGVHKHDEEVSGLVSSDKSSQCLLRKVEPGPKQAESDSSTCLKSRLESDEFCASHPPLFNVSNASIATIVNVEQLGNGPIWDITVDQFANYQTDRTTSTGRVIHGNSGKTTIVAVAIAAMVLNQPITMRDGSKLHMRPERWRNEPIKLWVVAFDWKHVGKTIWRVLFKPDLFRVIRDQKTGKWRAWDPSLPDDEGLKKLTRPSPPLIRMTDVMDGMNGISWMDRKERQISACTLMHDGTRMEFFPSTGAKPQGDPASVVWIDERIDDDRWYSELLVRLIDDQGRLVWTSWPDTHPSAALSELDARATKQLGDPNAKAFSYRFKGRENPYNQNETRDYVMTTMDEDTRKARDEGEMNMDRWRVYARFSRFVHRALAPDAASDDKLSADIRKHNGISNLWTRYMIFDPGTANPGVLFVAVPPPALGDYVVPYDELYPHYQNAEQIAKLIRGKAEGHLFEDFIADAHACRQTPMGFSGTVGENYERYLAQEKLTCRRRGSHFSYGGDEPLPRIMRTQGAMNIRSDGTPRLRIFGCPQLCSQLEVYKWAADPKGNPYEKPDPYQKVDLAVCLEYFFSRGDCIYVKPPNVTPEDRRSPASVSKAIQQFLGVKPKARDNSVYCGPGTPGR